MMTLLALAMAVVFHRFHGIFAGSAVRSAGERKLGDLRASDGVVTITGRVVGRSLHAAPISGKPAVRSRVTVEAWSGSDWVAVLFPLEECAPFLIDDGTATVAVAAGASIEGLPVSVFECRLETLPPALQRQVHTRHRPAELRQLAGQRLRVEEAVLVNGSTLHAVCQLAIEGGRVSARPFRLSATPIHHLIFDHAGGEKSFLLRLARNLCILIVVALVLIYATP